MEIGNAPTANIESVMAAKIQCYHIWLFYYLYSDRVELFGEPVHLQTQV